MLPEFDLLYKNPKKISPSKQLDMAMESLLLKETVDLLTVNPIYRRQIFELLRYPEQDRENLVWRQQALADFEANESLLHEFEKIHEKDLQLQESMKLLKRSFSEIQTSGNKSRTSNKDSAVSTIKTLADCVDKALGLYTAYKTAFGRAKVKSEIFTGMKSFVEEMTERPEFGELSALSSELFESVDLSTSYVILAKIDEYLRICDCEMFMLSSDPYCYGENSGSRKDKSLPVAFIGFEQESDSQLSFFAERSMVKLTNLLQSVVTQLRQPFEKLADGFFFYDFAFIYKRKLADLGLPCCTPEFNEKGCRFECRNIYDLWFALKQRQKDPLAVPGKTLVPNDAILTEDCPVCVISGRNNAGKTVFLRAIGLIQVLAQSGLPVPCTEALVTPAATVFAYFTSLDIGQGRFEEEVETCSGFLDVMQPNDLLLFNEVYQSTAYDEGSEALSEFMTMAALCGAKTVAVTHLPDIRGNMEKLRKEYGFKGTVSYLKAEEKDGKATHRFVSDVE